MSQWEIIKEFLCRDLDAWKEAAGWDPSKHPRDARGRFAGGGGGGSAKSGKTKGSGGGSSAESEGGLGGEIFKNEEMAKTFNAAYEQYSGMSNKELKETWDTEFKDYRDAVAARWKEDTKTVGATFLKAQAKEHEKLPGDFSASTGKISHSEIKGKPISSASGVKEALETHLKSKGLSKDEITSVMSPETYAKARALSQAYTRNADGDSIELWRGTDGRTGERIVNEIYQSAIRQEKIKLSFKEDCLVGYSSDKHAAAYFGPTEGGFMTRRKVKTSDVLLHPDLFGSRDEREYITRNTKKATSVPLKDLHLPQHHQHLAKHIGAHYYEE